MKTKAHLTALLISPDQALAQDFSEAAGRATVFQIVAELKTYPTEQALDVRLRQLRPDVVFLDLTTDLSTACEVIRAIAAGTSAVQIVGIHRSNDSDAVLNSLRAGASEFLCAPFDRKSQDEAGARLRRLLEPADSSDREPGRVITFASAKPGSGSSTIAAQLAFALRKACGKPTLLIDFDVTGGMLAFHLKLSPAKSIVDALISADHLNESVWSHLTATHEGVDILAGPEIPFTTPIDSARIHTVLEYARTHYLWTLVDLPVIFQRLSLMAVSEADLALIIATPELPSLHLGRKAVNLLKQLGFPKERFQMLMNRINKRDDIAIDDIEKLFDCSVHSRFPMDSFSLHRAVTLAEPVDTNSDLGKALEILAGRLSNGATERKTKTAHAEAKLQIS